jgi:hypothetical protein
MIGRDKILSPIRNIPDTMDATNLLRADCQFQLFERDIFVEALNFFRAAMESQISSD